MKRERHKIVIEFVDEKKGLEYYYNADGKLVSHDTDQTVGYRAGELAPEVAEQIERARAIHHYPSRPMIDNLIHMQESSIDKAATYVKYRLLGEASYSDVFGQDAEDRRAAQNHYKKQNEMAAQINEMAAQLRDMQTLIFNMAAQMNNQGGYKRRAI